MRLINSMHNIKQDIKMHITKHMYIYAPIFGLIIYATLANVLDISFDTDFNSNLINISGILAGFLFTSLGIIVALPQNKFTNLLKGNGYLKIIYRAMIIGIVTLLIAMLLGLFGLDGVVLRLVFIAGISETFISAYYLYRVGFYSSRSK